MKRNKKNTVDWENLIREVILLYNENTFEKNSNIIKSKVQKTPDKFEIEKETKIEEAPNKVETIKKNNVEEPPVKTETIKEIKFEEIPIKIETIEEIKIEETPIKTETIKEIRIEETPIKTEAIKEIRIEETPIKTEAIKEVKIEETPIKTGTRKEVKIEETPVKIETIKENKFEKIPIEVETKKEKTTEKAPVKVEIEKENKFEIRKENKNECRKHIENIPSKTSNSAFVDSKVIPLCTNIPVSQISSNGPLICKLPVILSQFQVQIDCEADIKFSKPSTNIIDVKSNIYITEYKLIVDVNKLFISGYIRESIQYNDISSNVKHMTVDIPFHCVTKVEFTTPPVLQENKPNMKYNLINCSIKGITEDDYNDLFFSNKEIFNEKIYCELLSAEILQIVSKVDNVEIEKCKDLIGCERIRNKITLSLTIRLYQNQSVNI